MQCQLGPSECRNGSCPDRAMCQDLPGVGTINCLCRSGYEGPACNITVNPCTTGDNPCLNGVTCMSLLQGRYKCIYTTGLIGPSCNINIGTLCLFYLRTFYLFICFFKWNVYDSDQLILLYVNCYNSACIVTKQFWIYQM